MTLPRAIALAAVVLALVLPALPAEAATATEVSVADSGIEFHGDWDRFIGQLDPVKFQARLVREMARANARIGHEFVRRSRKAIQGGAFAENSPMTVAFKDSSKPLVDDGDLFGSITWKRDPTDGFVVWVGANAASASGVRIDQLVHDGFTVRVTPKMRAFLFARLSKLAKGSGRKAKLARDFLGQWKPEGKPKGKGKMKSASPKQRRFFFAKLRESGKLARRGPAARDVYVIPARPYIMGIVEAPDFRQFVLREWEQAYHRALHERAA